MVKDKFAEIEIDLDDSAFLALAKEAHKRDITFNRLVNDILRDLLDREKTPRGRGKKKA